MKREFEIGDSQQSLGCRQVGMHDLLTSRPRRRDASLVLNEVSTDALWEVVSYWLLGIRGLPQSLNHNLTFRLFRGLK